MIGRRELFGAAAATVALAKTLQGEVARAASPAQAAEAMQNLAGLNPRGADGRLMRLATLDLESQQDFTMGFRRMHGRQLREASLNAFDRLLEAEGIDPAMPMSADEVRLLIMKDPAINLASKAWTANQQLTYKTLLEHLHANADLYLSEMAAADKAGPGALVLSPNMAIPDYARHEIHVQPGGYVGDPFAGNVYLHSTNSFYMGSRGHNDQDQIHRGAAAKIPLPADGKVRRILDMGCGVGQFSVALKERFPDAEVWGLDVAAPMVRFAHMRALRLGVGANFAQKLAEDTGFPDGHFDIVASYIMHHEVPAEITRRIIDEARRVTRPGGIYYPLDFKTGGVKAPGRAMYRRWMDHRWNNEVWTLEYHSVPFNDEIAKRGFTAARDPVTLLAGFGVRHFVRTA
jgi:ubiquinone/menaquinone biosynthesis C-methylase UbiE